MDYPEVPDSYFVVQLVDNFRFPREDEEPAINLINIDEDDDFSDPKRETSDSLLNHVL